MGGAIGSICKALGLNPTYGFSTHQSNPNANNFIFSRNLLNTHLFYFVVAKKAKFDVSQNSEQTNTDNLEPPPTVTLTAMAPRKLSCIDEKSECTDQPEMLNSPTSEIAAIETDAMTSEAIDLSDTDDHSTKDISYDDQNSEVLEHSE